MFFIKIKKNTHWIWDDETRFAKMLTCFQGLVFKNNFSLQHSITVTKDIKLWPTVLWVASATISYTHYKKLQKEMSFKIWKQENSAQKHFTYKNKNYWTWKYVMWSSRSNQNHFLYVSSCFFTRGLLFNCCTYMSIYNFCSSHFPFIINVSVVIRHSCKLHLHKYMLCILNVSSGIRWRPVSL